MMDCKNSMAPTDEELLSYALDNEPLSRTMEEHITQCPVCQQRLKDYKQTNAYLLAKLYRTQCPSATKLNYYCANLLPIDEVIRVDNHLRICPLCANEVVTIGQSLASIDLFPG